MPNLGVLIKFIIWNHIQIIASSSVSFANEWNDWIIIPSRHKTSFIDEKDDSSKNFSVFDVNSSKSVKSYINPGAIETFVMRTVTINDNNWKQQSRHLNEENNRFDSKNELVIPLGRAIEKVKAFCSTFMEFLKENSLYNTEKQENPSDSSRKLKKLKKKYKKFLFPLLLAYKLKFVALIPLLMGGLVLLVGTTGMSGFFFALFTAVMSLKGENKVEVKKW